MSSQYNPSQYGQSSRRSMMSSAGGGSQSQYDQSARGSFVSSAGGSQMMSRMSTAGYIVDAIGKKNPNSPFEIFQILRGASQDHDVEIDVHFCGISAFDVQFCHNDLDTTLYPIVPGREMTGVVRWVGRDVKNVSAGQHVAVGTVVDSCLRCEECLHGKVHACRMGFTMAYNDPTRHRHVLTDSGYTYGGFSERITVHEKFVIKIPTGLSLEAAAACLTTATAIYSPLKRLNAIKTPGLRIGVMGIGNVGMHGIRMCSAMGHQVTAMSVHDNLEPIAYELGAASFLSWAKAEDMKKAHMSFDIIFNTLSASHDVATFLPLLDYQGTMVQLGLMNSPHSVAQYPDLIRPSVCIIGSIGGDLADIRETMKWFASNGVRPVQTIVLADQLDDVFEVLSNPATTIARYTLGVRESFDRLKENEMGLLGLPSRAEGGRSGGRPGPSRMSVGSLERASQSPQSSRRNTGLSLQKPSSSRASLSRRGVSKTTGSGSAKKTAGGSRSSKKSDGKHSAVSRRSRGSSRSKIGASKRGKSTASKKGKDDSKRGKSTASKTGDQKGKSRSSKKGDQKGKSRASKTGDQKGKSRASKTGDQKGKSRASKTGDQKGKSRASKKGKVDDKKGKPTASRKGESAKKSSKSRPSKNPGGNKSSKSKGSRNSKTSRKSKK